MTYRGNEAALQIPFRLRNERHFSTNSSSFVCLHVSYYLGPLSPRFIAELIRVVASEPALLTVITLRASCKILESVGGDGMCNSFRYASNESSIYFGEEIF